ncbi:MAG: GNAT family N-acetyltransferase [Planctomycetes bacterium]|nr:GNAT family N-acetyltransferase [Planctomycetota bacterium]
MIHPRSWAIFLRSTMNQPVIIDLDQRPELTARVVALFAACAPGRDHVVCGIPARMGLTPTADDLKRCSGVLVATRGAQAIAALAICPYSEQQVTFWGPACAEGALAAFGAPLVAAARRALGAADFASTRTLVDVRNRDLRRFLLGHGFSAWKDDHICERELAAALPEAAAGVRLTARRHHAAVAELLTAAFTDSGHATPDLATREREGFRHYHLEDGGEIVAAAAVEDGGRRSWLKLIAVRPDRRGSKAGKRLLGGILHHEAQRGFATIGLEVLADNAIGIGLFERMGFMRRFTATVLVGPV